MPLKTPLFARPALTHWFAGRPGATVDTRLARGRPEQEIIHAAAQIACDLLVVGARYQGGPRPASGPPSVGHVARFVLDHAPCDVLLLR